MRLTRRSLVGEGREGTAGGERVSPNDSDCSTFGGKLFRKKEKPIRRFFSREVTLLCARVTGSESFVASLRCAVVTSVARLMSTLSRDELSCESSAQMRSRVRIETLSSEKTRGRVWGSRSSTSNEALDRLSGSRKLPARISPASTSEEQRCPSTHGIQSKHVSRHRDGRQATQLITDQKLSPNYAPKLSCR